MNTPAHLLVGAAVFARPATAAVLVVALLGAALPDASVVLLVAWAQYVQGHSPSVIFNQLYFSDSWQTVFAIDNSIILWGALLLWALWRKLKLTAVFSGAAVLHLIADLFLHHDDGRAHFWPATRWKFESPVSYWDGAHHGSIAAAALFFVSLIAFSSLLRRFQSWPTRGLFTTLLLGEGYFAWVWISYF